MQPQQAQMMGQVAPAGAMGQQVIIVQNRSGGPKVFGIIAIVLGGLGIIGTISGVGEWDGALWIFMGLMGLASSGILIWAGVLLVQYQKKGVWIGFGSVAMDAVSGLVLTIVAADAVGGIDSGWGESVAGFGLVLVGIRAICCSAVIALPLLMNGADLE
jgi:hypothetical protein